MMLALAPCLALFAGFCRVYDPACGSGGMFVRFSACHVGGSNCNELVLA
jgi:type I restriction-modification system DNA methylase subunit